MKIPSKLKIGGHIFQVIIDDIGDDNKAGETDYNSNTIIIDKNLTQSQKEQTLIHELFHAMNGEIHGTDLGHWLLESFSQQLYQILSDNKMLK